MICTFHLQGSLPRISEVKALDIWNFSCLFFVFSSLIEVTVIHIMERNARKMDNNTVLLPKIFTIFGKRSRFGHVGCVQKEGETRQGYMNNNGRINMNDFDLDKLQMAQIESGLSGNEGGSSGFGEEIHRKCRLWFPVMFLIFNVIYWWIYTVGEEG